MQWINNQPDPLTASGDTPECLRGRQTPRTRIWLIEQFKTQKAIQSIADSNKTQQINSMNSVLTVFFNCGRLRWISRQPAGQIVGNQVPYRLMWRVDRGDGCGGSTRRDEIGRREFSWWCISRAKKNNESVLVGLMWPRGKKIDRCAVWGYLRHK